MKLKKVIITAGVIGGVYLIGKAVGAHDTAKAMLDEYADVIPENSLTINVLNKAGFKMSVTAVKGES